MTDYTLTTIKISYQFKGGREYIHGTDMFNSIFALDDSFSSATNIRFTIHGFVQTPFCFMYIANDKRELGSLTDVKVRCQFDIGDVTYWLALVENEGDVSTGTHYEYDEDQIICRSRMVEDGIKLTNLSPYSFIESVVAMNKYMHQNLFPDASGKWIFTRIDLDEFVSARDELSLQLKHNLNYRLTRSDILIDGSKIGDLYFSLVK